MGSELYDRKIDAMHKEYGILPGSRCADCCNLGSYTQSRRWYKCEAYGESSSIATDWRLKWIACGLFNKPFDPVTQRPMIHKLKHQTRKKPDEIPEGQISMFGEG